MKRYGAGPFFDRPLASALALSILWHTFWFLSLGITAGRRPQPKEHPKIVSLGAVLDDSIFRTLVESRPEVSEAFYRHLSDFAAPQEAPVQTIERHSPGDVVSVPVSRRFLTALRGIVGGTKASPDAEFASRLSIGYEEGPLEVEGELRGREIVSRPEQDPAFPETADPALRDAVTEIEIAVDPMGAVTAAEVSISGGSPAVDALWMRHVRRFQFAPLTPSGRPALEQRGRVRLRFAQEG